LKELLNQQVEYLGYNAKLSSATYKSTNDLMSVVSENNKNISQSIQGLQQQVTSLKDLMIHLINEKFNEVISH
jgi:hypothetical protein